MVEAKARVRVGAQRQLSQVSLHLVGVLLPRVRVASFPAPGGGAVTTSESWRGAPTLTSFPAPGGGAVESRLTAYQRSLT